MNPTGRLVIRFDLINQTCISSENEARCLVQTGVPPTWLRYVVAGGKQHCNLEWNSLIAEWPSDFFTKILHLFFFLSSFPRDRSHAWIQTLGIRTPLSVLRLVVSPLCCTSNMHILSKDSEKHINHSSLETLTLPNHTNYIHALYLQIFVFFSSWPLILRVANNKVRHTNIFTDVSEGLTASNV